jgi:hypothetical protein
MYKWIAAMLACASLTTLSVVGAQNTPPEGKAKTQGDIMNERAKACEGLRDGALQECMDNYVGPSRDLSTSEADQKTTPNSDHKAASDSKDKAATDKEQQAHGEKEHDGSSQVDTLRSNKRAPVGPIRSGPEQKSGGDQKQQ